jgi:hypothetical protein
MQQSERGSEGKSGVCIILIGEGSLQGKLKGKVGLAYT